jgi:DNA processing protein
VLANLPDDPRRTGLARTPLFARTTAEGLADDTAMWDIPPDPDIDIAAAQSNILRLLSPSPTDLDDLIRRSLLPASAVSAALMQLELALRVEFLPGNRVCRV